jgi:hypothetical protein
VREWVKEAPVMEIAHTLFDLAVFLPCVLCTMAYTVTKVLMDWIFPLHLFVLWGPGNINRPRVKHRRPLFSG